MNEHKEQQKGFTIIEVVLVLAIAGLIFLMVFIALPALQRSQRDTQRRNDASTFISQLTSYATNNRGNLPSNNDDSIQAFAQNYLKIDDGGFKDPKSGNPYTIKASNGAPTKVGTFYYLKKATCKDETITPGAGNRQAAIAVKLEGSGVFCQEVQ